MWYFILIPVVWVAITKVIWHKHVSASECALHLAAVIPITALIFAMSYFSNVSDTLLIHGQVTEKVRDNDSHQESYSCNCRTVSRGSGNNRTTRTVCDTCWRTVYTVDWYLKSTIGNIQIDYERSYSSSVWSTKDPKNYVDAYVGEPCSKIDRYTNYVKASPDSLFNNSAYSTTSKLPIPSYPQIKGIYKVDTVLNVGTKVDITGMEEALSEKLKVLGHQKQVNVVLVFANTADPLYRHALERSWIGGKKNDVVIIIGTVDNINVAWADGFTFGLSQGNHLMLTQILDNIRGKELKSIDVVDIVTKEVAAGFKRKQMEDFKYLRGQISHSTGLLIFVFVLQLLSNIGITFYSIKNEL